MYPFLEFQPEGGWETFHAAGVSGIPTDPFIPETGEAVHVKLYEGPAAVDGIGTTGGVMDAPIAGDAAGGAAGGGAAGGAAGGSTKVMGITAVCASAEGGAP